MTENLSKDKNRKVFEMKKRTGDTAQFTFVKEEGVWFWEIPHKQGTELKKHGIMPSLPLPDVDLDNCNTLKECFDAIAKKRGELWVGQIFADIMHS